jgi:pimeloyl-ACP methyl ester carboxylesterase
MAGIGQIRSAHSLSIIGRLRIADGTTIRINSAFSGYSAVVDAQDLAAFLHALHLGKVVVIGHSYGALTALFLAVKHPELVRALVLAEPPAISLLAHLPGDKAQIGKAMFETSNGELCQRALRNRRAVLEKYDMYN